MSLRVSSPPAETVTALRRRVGWWVARLLLVALIAWQLVTIIRGYEDPHRVFAFQMFRESSSWEADIFRVTASGDRIDVQEPWGDPADPYHWSDLVRGQGLDHPFSRHHAVAGLDATFDFSQHALNWTALNTPRDTETLRLEAVVTYWDNDRGPFRIRFKSVDRPGVGPP